MCLICIYTLYKDTFYSPSHVLPLLPTSTNPANFCLNIYAPPPFSVFAIFDAVICLVAVAIATAAVAVKPPLLTPASTQLAYSA